MSTDRIYNFSSKDGARQEIARSDGREALLLRELLCVTLDVCAHVKAYGAQLDRARAQLERLDVRLSTLEQRRLRGSRGPMAPGAAFARVRSAPAIAPRARPMTLLDLEPDALDKVIACLDPDDELAASLACRKLHDVLRGVRTSAQRPLKTRLRSLLDSLGKLRWGVACAGAPLRNSLLARVAGLGDLRMLSWLCARGCPWRPDADELAAYAEDDELFDGPCTMAAVGGHLSVLRWLHASGCPWDRTRTCSRAAEGGHLSVLQWLRANGCPWNEGTCQAAAEEGHLSVLQWARANGCPWDAEKCAASAAARGHMDVLLWARANGSRERLRRDLRSNL